MKTTITQRDFTAAKKAAKATFHYGACVDSSAAHSAAIKTLQERCPDAILELITDMAWQCVLAARGF